MVEKGARNIVLISRSGAVTGKVADLIRDAGTVGANITVYPCDVADKAQVDRLITKDVADLPPIRGVIHAAMVLNVSQTARLYPGSSLISCRIPFLRKWTTMTGDR